MTDTLYLTLDLTDNMPHHLTQVPDTTTNNTQTNKQTHTHILTNIGNTKTNVLDIDTGRYALGDTSFYRLQKRRTKVSKDLIAPIIRLV